MTDASGKFSSYPAMRQLGRWQWELLERLVFVDPVFGAQTIPAGFRSDLASIRILREICRWMLIAGLIGSMLGVGGWLSGLSCLANVLAVVAMALYALLAGYGVRMALVHDWLYATGHLSRRSCDAVLYRAATTGEGMARWRAGLFWIGVRVGGFTAYRRA